MINNVPLPPKKSLGKGLSALLNQNTALNQNKDIESFKEPASEILITEIDPNPYQPRKEFPSHEMNELVDSIVSYGVIQPIIVRKINNRYQIIAGERRWQACKRLGLATIPAVVKDVSEKEVYELALIENIQRQNLNAIEEASAYDKMITQYGFTQDHLSKKIGKSRSHISNTMRLLLLPEYVKNLVANSQISPGHARALVNAPNAESLAEKIVNEGWSVRRTEHEIRKIHNPSTYLRANSSGNQTKPDLQKLNDLSLQVSIQQEEKDGDLVEIEQMLCDALNLPVKINDTNNGGQVIIEFTCLEELDIIIKKLTAENLSF